jgi:hypothetical protein
MLLQNMSSLQAKLHLLCPNLFLAPQWTTGSLRGLHSIAEPLSSDQMTKETEDRVGVRRLRNLEKVVFRPIRKRGPDVSCVMDACSTASIEAELHKASPEAVALSQGGRHSLCFSLEKLCKCCPPGSALHTTCRPSQRHYVIVMLGNLKSRTPPPSKFPNFT